MINLINIDKVIFNKDYSLIDVRSPKEFDNDSIPGAINIPILSDKEREYVGYVYKQVDSNKAKELGLGYASEKLVDIYKRIKEIKETGKKIVLFCYRGGMRSNSVANVLNIMGVNVSVLNGGYKSYRKFIVNNLPKYKDKFKYIVIHGYTGVGKTKILERLEDEGHPVVDLEKLASNSGSVFGEMTYDNPSTSQKKFETLLFNNLYNSDHGYFFIESESKRIGKVILPNFLHKNMKDGYHVLIKTNMENRVNNIVEDYISSDINDKDEKIIKAIKKLNKRLGKIKTNKLIESITNKDYNFVIETLMTDYYDPLYDYSIDKIKEYDTIIQYETIEEAKDKLIKFAKEHIS
ncbi:tRNA 2-selenouridine(34) synthase MnmH [Dethiothermospora halolimnae]|uniref:tRNA 2-selenouridine(34) synthase MnmH n=1 Tax=Dethiothermospora halolimnae TaxID=3114390 RepID=UPI003CCBAC87